MSENFTILDLESIHPRKRKIQWFPPLPLKFSTGPLVGSSTILKITINAILEKKLFFQYTLPADQVYMYNVAIIAPRKS